MFLALKFAFHVKSNQGNQDSSGNQKNVIKGQRPDIENRQAQEHKVTKIIHTKFQK